MVNYLHFDSTGVGIHTASISSKARRLK
jgi:hypothetical protein